MIGAPDEGFRVHKNREEVDEDLVEWGLKTGVFYNLPSGRPWLVSAEPLVETDDGDTITVKCDEEERKKARRQPSRTVVVQKRSSWKGEEEDSDVDADAEDE